jgi:hypothetical protein
MGIFNGLFGLSIYLLVLDAFLDAPEDLMNLREVARRVEKTPGSVRRALPLLINRALIASKRVGAKVVAYQLNTANDVVATLQAFHGELERSYFKDETDG